MSSNLAQFALPASDAPIEWALAYAAAGMRIFPVRADKTPLTKHGVKDATTDEAQIRAWWTSQPYADIAWAVPAEIVVMDADVGKGANGLKEFAAHEGAHPDDVVTPQASSPRGGRHVVFEANGAVYRNNVRLNGSAIDPRTDGGYVVAARACEWPRLDQTPRHAARAGAEMASSAPKAKPSPPQRARSPARRLTPAPRSSAPAWRSKRRRTANRKRRSTRSASASAASSAPASSTSRPRSAALTAAAHLMPAYAEPWRDLEVKVRRSVEDGMRQPRSGAGSQAKARRPDLVWR